MPRKGSVSEPKKKLRAQGEKLRPAERPEVQRLFLDALADSGVVRRALSVAGVSRTTLDRWKADPAFLALYSEAEQDANDLIRAEIRRRAIDGDETTRVDKNGNEFTSVQRSDTLLIFLAKARMPEFRDTTKQDVTVQGNLGMQIVYAPMMGVIPEERS